ncbi:putative RNA-binding protein Pno1p [Zopfochytrium polystomum]|nr:putative RNA-binding protein Pno1p [Zopfochytrium polystomum]
MSAVVIAASELESPAAAAPATVEVEMDLSADDDGESRDVPDDELAAAVAAIEAKKPEFAALRRQDMKGQSRESRTVPVPPHRLTPLKKNWLKIYTPLVEHLKLEVRMNTKRRAVEMRTCKLTEDTGAVQKGADFIRAFCLGFDVADAMALLRLDDLYIDTFETKDVKTLTGNNLSRAVGRVVGKDGRTKFAIENATRTRIVVADCKVHILGSFSNIKMARDACVSLILGSSPGKVYTKLRAISARAKERF